MKKASMSKGTIAELLLFLAEHESFAASEKLLQGSMSSGEIAALLHELALTLRHEAGMEDFSPAAQKVFSSLKENEVQSLLSSFGLLE